MSRKKLSKNYEKPKLANNAADLIRVATDPAALVLFEMILHSIDLKHNRIANEERAALIEIDTVKGEDVIANAAERLNRMDHRFTCLWYELDSQSQDWNREKIRELFNEMALISQSNPYTIHIMKDIDLSALPEDAMNELEKIFYRGEDFQTVYRIYVCNEQSYKIFAEKLDPYQVVKPIWLHPLPGEKDIYSNQIENRLARGRPTVINDGIFTADAKALLNRARRKAELMKESKIDTLALLKAAADGAETKAALIQLLNISEENLKIYIEDSAASSGNGEKIGTLYYEDSMVEVVRDAMKLASAEGIQDRIQPGLLSHFHLIAALAMNYTGNKVLGTNRKLSFNDAANKLGTWLFDFSASPTILGRSEILPEIGFIEGEHRQLYGNLFGQREALDTIFEYLTVEQYRKECFNNSRPVTTLLFVGPESTGKLHLARQLAEIKDLPLYQHDFTDCPKEKTLTFETKSKFVKHAISVFQNLHKANPIMLAQICHLIRNGKLIDHKTGDELDFNGTIFIIIVDTDHELFGREVGLPLLNREMRQSEAMAVLKNQSDPLSELPLIPPQIFALLEKQQLVLFNQLRVEDLHNICERKMAEYCAAIEKSEKKKLTYSPLLPQALICGEGGNPTAMALSTAIEVLFSSELRKFISGQAERGALYILTPYDRIHFDLHYDQEANDDVAALFRTTERPKVLIYLEQAETGYLAATNRQVDWYPVNSFAELVSAAAEGRFDFALLDLWFNKAEKGFDKRELINDFLVAFLGIKSRLPLSVTALDFFGQKHWQAMHELASTIPLVMLNPIDEIWRGAVQEYRKRPSSYYLETADELRKIREEFNNYYPSYNGSFRYDLFMEMLDSFGIRGMINTDLFGQGEGQRSENADLFLSSIDQIHQKLHREKMGEELDRRKQVLRFDRFWEIDESENLVTVALKNLRLEGKIFH